MPTPSDWLILLVLHSHWSKCSMIASFNIRNSFSNIISTSFNSSQQHNHSRLHSFPRALVGGENVRCYLEVVIVWPFTHPKDGGKYINVLPIFEYCILKMFIFYLKIIVIFVLIYFPSSSIYFWVMDEPVKSKLSLLNCYSTP